MREEFEVTGMLVAEVLLAMVMLVSLITIFFICGKLHAADGRSPRKTPELNE